MHFNVNSSDVSSKVFCCLCKNSVSYSRPLLLLSRNRHLRSVLEPWTWLFAHEKSVCVLQTTCEGSTQNIAMTFHASVTMYTVHCFPLLCRISGVSDVEILRKLANILVTAQDNPRTFSINRQYLLVFQFQRKVDMISIISYLACSRLACLAHFRKLLTQPQKEDVAKPLQTLIFSIDQVPASLEFSTE